VKVPYNKDSDKSLLLEQLCLTLATVKQGEMLNKAPLAMSCLGNAFHNPILLPPFAFHR